MEAKEFAMASTSGKLDIYNMALGFVGTRTVASPNERVPEAIQCELYWDTARRAALRDYPYGFAQRRVLLAEKAMPDVYSGQWRFCYGVPDGALKIHAVHDGRNREPLPRPWKTMNADGGRIILSDVDEAMADVTMDVEEVSLWDELFVMAMARKLASLIAVPLLKNNSGKVQELVQLYKMAIPQADGQDASERASRMRPDAWLLSRETW